MTDDRCAGCRQNLPLAGHVLCADCLAGSEPE